jgi:hypothetical protein
MNTKRNRYPGTQPFSIEFKDSFYGREDDIKKLEQLIMLEDMIVLFGKSGLGKTSLLKAGIYPRIEPKDYIIISTRFDAYCQDSKETLMDVFIKKAKTNTRIDDSHVKELFSNVLEEISITNKETEVFDIMWLYFKAFSIKNPNKTCLLVFDQFEELFSHKAEDIDKFCKGLSSLLSNATPSVVRKAILKKQDHQIPESLVNELLQPLKLKTLFSIRHDKLSLLYRLLPYFPELLKNTYELLSLTDEQARQAIVYPAQDEGDNYTSLPFGYTKEAIDKILKTLKPKDSSNIESFHLQMICQHIEQRVMTEKLKIVDIDKIRNIEKLAADFYENTLKKIPLMLRSRVQQVLEDEFISEGEQRRITRFENYLLENQNIPRVVLDTLVDNHLLRRRQKDANTVVYEISHDSFIEPLLKAKNQRIQFEKQRKLKQRKRLWTIAIFVSVIMLILAIALYAKEKDNKELIESRNKLIEANKQKDSINEKLESANHLKDSINRQLEEVNKQKEDINRELQVIYTTDKGKLGKEISILKERIHELELKIVEKNTNDVRFRKYIHDLLGNRNPSTSNDTTLQGITKLLRKVEDTISNFKNIIVENQSTIKKLEKSKDTLMNKVAVREDSMQRLFLFLDTLKTKNAKIQSSITDANTNYQVVRSLIKIDSLIIMGYKDIHGIKNSNIHKDSLLSKLSTISEENMHDKSLFIGITPILHRPLSTPLIITFATLQQREMELINIIIEINQHVTRQTLPNQNPNE